jgi:hypothetical protein
MTWRVGPTLASESAVAAPGFTRCRAQNSMRGRCQVSNPRGDEEGQQADEDALQGGRGNPAEARRFFGCEANGMGGRRTLRFPSRARVSTAHDQVSTVLRNGSKRDPRRWRAHPTNTGAAASTRHSEVEPIAMGGSHGCGDAVVIVPVRFGL